jgi:hypothetical protein
MRLWYRVLGLPVRVVLLGIGGRADAAATGAHQCSTVGLLGLTGVRPDLSVGRGRFFLDILNGPPPGQVLFPFRNIGPAPSSISGILLADRGAEGMLGPYILPGEQSLRLEAIK